MKTSRAYNSSPLGGFIAIGFIATNEAEKIKKNIHLFTNELVKLATQNALRNATDRELALEILRRAEENESAHPTTLTTPTGPASDIKTPTSAEDEERVRQLAQQEGLALAANTDKEDPWGCGRGVGGWVGFWVARWCVAR